MLIRVKILNLNLFSATHFFPHIKSQEHMRNIFAKFLNKVGTNLVTGVARGVTKLVTGVARVVTGGVTEDATRVSLT
jgi:hypothetical protein